MKAEQQFYTIETILEFRKNSMLVVNSEYQRGVVWTLTQKRKLIDSVLRGYPLPVIYLHSIKKTVGSKSRDDLEIIDGQQRITALHEYHEGAFTLFDPKIDTEKARFPAFIREQGCPWAGLGFKELSDELKNKFLQTTISVAEIETDNANEVRDLFVRLQGGSALNHQETRDAWPGGFNDFILGFGGKPEVSRYPGHSFFTKTLGMKPSSDRGKTRQLAAQISMLVLYQRVPQKGKVPDISASAINDFYYDHLDFDADGSDATRLRKIATTIERVLSGHNVPKLHAHDAMHAALLVDALLEEYAPSWEAKFPSALLDFMKRLALGKKNNDAGKLDPYWMEYGQWTRTNSDRGDNIARRHRFYRRKMVEAMEPLKPLDPKRIFGNLERRILFFAQHGKCAVCGGQVEFDEMEVHHVEEHSKGGLTKLENGAIVHPVCHPKSVEATQAFASSWASRPKASDEPIDLTEFEP